MSQRSTKGRLIFHESMEALTSRAAGDSGDRIARGGFLFARAKKLERREGSGKLRHIRAQGRVSLKASS